MNRSSHSLSLLLTVFLAAGSTSLLAGCDLDVGLGADTGGAGGGGGGGTGGCQDPEGGGGFGMGGSPGTGGEGGFSMGGSPGTGGEGGFGMGGSPGSECGDGVCDPAVENAMTCPADCAPN